MEKLRYMISDAADMVHVETHVLRYWEEELGLSFQEMRWVIDTIHERILRNFNKSKS